MILKPLGVSFMTSGVKDSIMLFTMGCMVEVRRGWLASHIFVISSPKHFEVLDAFQIWVSLFYFVLLLFQALLHECNLLWLHHLV